MIRLQRPARYPAGPRAARRARAVLAGAAGLLAAAAVAQEAGPPRGTALTGSITVQEDVSETRSRPSGANGLQYVTRILPALQLISRTGALRGRLDYVGTLQLREGLPGNETTEYTNTLSADFVLEAIRDHGFVDARASVTQQSISAAGQPVNSLLSNENRTEVRTVTLSPYLRGNLAGDAAEYELRGSGTVTNTDDSASPDSKSATASAVVRSAGRTRLGWSLSGQRQKVAFSTAPAATTTDRALAELFYSPDIDWRFSLSGGQETTDVIGGQRTDYENYGLSIQWTPSPRTSVLLSGEERYFGRAHRMVLEYRLPRTRLRYSDAREVSSGADTLTAVASTANTGFVQAGFSVQRRRELGVNWQAPRTTFDLSGYRTRSERVDVGGVNVAGLNDDVRLSGYNASLSYRLTARDSVTLNGSRALSQSDGITGPARSDLKSLSVTLTSQLGRRTIGTLGARYSVLNESTDPYRETAISGSLSLRF